jgi:chromate transporter
MSEASTTLSRTSRPRIRGSPTAAAALPVTLIHRSPSLDPLVGLFWLFLKINLLSTSGIASVGLLHQEAVGTILTEEQFVQAVSFSSVLPGSDALQLAMFTGYRVAGLSGAGAALLGSLLPPTILILAVVTILHRLRREAWVSRFVEGLAPAVAVLMFVVAGKLLMGGVGANLDWALLLIGVLSLVAFTRHAPPPLVLLAAGLFGVLVYR